MKKLENMSCRNLVIITSPCTPSRRETILGLKDHIHLLELADRQEGFAKGDFM